MYAARMPFAPTFWQDCNAVFGCHKTGMTGAEGIMSAMACSAFAIFLQARIFAPFRALARRLGLVRAWQPASAAEWRRPRDQRPQLLLQGRLTVPPERANPFRQIDGLHT